MSSNVYSKQLYEVVEDLKKVTEKCKFLEEQVKLLNKTIDCMSRGKVLIKVSEDEYRLPDTLDKTISALKQLQTPASASEVSFVTKRARAVESHYLCVLENFGILSSFRDHKIKRFKIKIVS